MTDSADSCESPHYAAGPREIRRNESVNQLPLTPWISGKNNSFQSEGFAFSVPTPCMKSAYFISASGDVV
jgi:hypothetical protein